LEKAKATYDDLCLWYPHALRDPSLKGFNFRVLPSLEMVDGAWCHVVEKAGWQKFWVDSKLNCACRKRERFNSNPADPQLCYREILSDFEEALPGVWLPRCYRRDRYVSDKGMSDLRGKIHLEDVIQVEKIEVNSVVDSDFKLPIPAGVTIWDKAHNRLFRSPGDTDDAMRDLTIEAQHIVQTTCPAWKRWAIAAASAAVVFLTCVFLKRRAKKTV
jgi:hypothetical protein